MRFHSHLARYKIQDSPSHGCATGGCSSSLPMVGEDCRRDPTAMADTSRQMHPTLLHPPVAHEGGHSRRCMTPIGGGRLIRRGRGSKCKQVGACAPGARYHARGAPHERRRIPPPRSPTVSANGSRLDGRSPVTTPRPESKRGIPLREWVPGSAHPKWGSLAVNPSMRLLHGRY